ncbi:hypothetical protein FRC08_002290 [Ceratobasidium sp. 394]|nr:hypothetical protein FRC08_002290 [Ceratobasidium sp. 394]
MESLSLTGNAPSVSAKKGESESEDWGKWEEEKMRELEEALSKNTRKLVEALNDSLSMPALIPKDQL